MPRRTETSRDDFPPSLRLLIPLESSRHLWFPRLPCVKSAPELESPRPPATPAGRSPRVMLPPERVPLAPAECWEMRIENHLPPQDSDGQREQTFSWAFSLWSNQGGTKFPAKDPSLQRQAGANAHAAHLERTRPRRCHGVTPSLGPMIETPYSPASPVTAVPPVTVTFSRMALTTFSASSGLSRNVCFAASRPWPTSSPW